MLVSHSSRAMQLAASAQSFASMLPGRRGAVLVSGTTFVSIIACADSYRDAAGWLNDGYISSKAACETPKKEHTRMHA